MEFIPVVGCPCQNATNRKKSERYNGIKFLVVKLLYVTSCIYAVLIASMHIIIIATFYFHAHTCTSVDLNVIKIA